MLGSISYLEFVASILVEGPIIIQDVYELEFMSHANVIIIWIVSWCNFDRTSPEIHVDCNVVSNDWNKSVDEGVSSKFAV